MKKTSQETLSSATHCLDLALEQFYQDLTEIANEAKEGEILIYRQNINDLQRLGNK